MDGFLVGTDPNRGESVLVAEKNEYLVGVSRQPHSTFERLEISFRMSE